MSAPETIGTELPEWSSPDDLGAWLGIPPKTIYQWRYRGVGPRAHVIGRHLRFRRADVEAWLRQQAS